MTPNFPVLNSCHCFVFRIFRGCNIYVPKVSKELNESLVHRNLVNKHTSQMRRQCSLFINSMKKSVVLHAKFFRAKFLFYKKFFNFNKRGWSRFPSCSPSLCKFLLVILCSKFVFLWHLRGI